MAITQEISDMLDIGHKPSQVVSVIFPITKWLKIAENWVFPWCDGSRWWPLKAIIYMSTVTA